MTFCMNVSRFMNLAAIFSLDLESQCNGFMSKSCQQVSEKPSLKFAQVSFVKT